MNNLKQTAVGLATQGKGYSPRNYEQIPENYIRNSFTAYESFEPHKKLPDDMRLLIYDAVFAFALRGELIINEDDNPIAAAVFQSMKNTIAAGRLKSYWGTLGGAPQGNENNPSGRGGKDKEPSINQGETKAEPSINQGETKAEPSINQGETKQDKEQGKDIGKDIDKEREKDKSSSSNSGADGDEENSPSLPVVKAQKFSPPQQSFEEAIDGGKTTDYYSSYTQLCRDLTDYYFNWIKAKDTYGVDSAEYKNCEEGFKRRVKQTAKLEGEDLRLAFCLFKWWAIHNKGNSSSMQNMGTAIDAAINSKGLSLLDIISRTKETAIRVANTKDKDLSGLLIKELKDLSK